MSLKQKDVGILKNDLGWLKENWKSNRKTLNDATKSTSALNYLTMDCALQYIQLVNLAIVPISVTLEVKDTAEETEEIIKKIIARNKSFLKDFNSVQEDLKLNPEPNWVALWKVPPDCQWQKWNGSKKSESFCAKYPVVWFLAHIERYEL